MKTNSQGNLLWQRSFGGTGEQKGQDLVETSDGGFLISSERSFYMVRTDANGALVWERTVGTSNDVARSLNEAPSGEFLLAGYRGTSELVPELDARILKLSGSGSVVQNLTFDTGYDDLSLLFIPSELKSSYWAPSRLARYLQFPCSGQPSQTDMERLVAICCLSKWKGGN
jgi:hypothetical protein